MPKYSSSRHPLVDAVTWRPDEPAAWVNDFVVMSGGTSSGYVVLNDAAGDVVINTGTSREAKRYRERVESLVGRPLAVGKIMLTQFHFDHSGGWEVFADPAVETIVQRDFPWLVEERAMLGPFFHPRSERILHAITPSTRGSGTVALHPALPHPLTLFADDHAFELGGRRFEMIAAPSGETLDSAWVWLPDERILFTGNWMGALYGALPNFYTARGDRDRSVSRFIKDIRRLIELRPALLLTGHGQPIRGEERIRSDMTKLHDAVRHIHDATVAGMNAQKDLHTLMREIDLPPGLDMAPGRGPVRWYVRMVWEEYAGWFRHDLTSELYELPGSAIWPELCEMAGGPEALVERARARLAADEPLHALHFVEIALAAAPGDRSVRETQLAVLDRLIERTNGESFDELGWLEAQVASATEALGEG